MVFALLEGVSALTTLWAIYLLLTSTLLFTELENIFHYCLRFLLFGSMYFNF